MNSKFIAAAIIIFVIFIGFIGDRDYGKKE